MGMDTIRDAPLGTWMRYTAWGRKLLPYPEEEPGFQPPQTYQGHAHAGSSSTSTLVPGQASPGRIDDSERSSSAEPKKSPANIVTEKRASPNGHDVEAQGTPFPAPEKSSKAAHGGASPKNEDYIVVGWYGEDDPACPSNWSAWKKTWVAFDILLLTFTVYGGSSMITASFPGLIQKFHIGVVEVTTTLALYVFAYGFGALVFSPLSEINKLGRNVFYIYPMIAFVAFQAGAATVDTFYGSCILRFLTGFMGAPCLATGGASLQDIASPAMLGPLISLWALSAFAAPATAPVMGNYAAVYMDNWRWPMYILLIQVGVSTACLAFLPETSHNNILYNRAKRLRQLTGNKKIRAQAEIDSANMTKKDIFVEAIVRPTEIFFKDPAITYCHMYTAFMYGIYYLFFESWPLVYEGIYHFSFQVSGLGYLSFIVGGAISFVGYNLYLGTRFGPIFKRGEMPLPEQWLEAALFSSVLAPIGTFIFAWTARESVHWIVSLIGVMLLGIANFVTLQCLFAYILAVYPKYGASLLAGNDFLRSSLAAGLLFGGNPMFRAMGIGGGNSFLAGLLVLGTIGAYGLWMTGARLRARSKYAT